MRVRNESGCRYNRDGHVYNFVSQTDNIARTRKRLSELWLVFLKRKLRFASKEEGGLAHQRRLICIGGKSTLELTAVDWALGELGV